MAGGLSVQKLIFMIFIVSVLFLSSVTVYAQNGRDVEATEQSDTEKEKPLDFSQISSLFFTRSQHEAIVDAMNRRGVARPVSPEELAAMERGENVKPDIGIRELSLGGIVYRGRDDWVIWLNDTRVTPGAVPKEVMDLEVFKEYIQVKWFDEHTNSIYPVRLRPHQRFNLDMRIYLTGESVK